MNKKIIYTILLLLVTSFVMTAKAEAKSNWDQYFSVEEAKSIKNMVKKSILSEFENPDGDWKKLIGSKMLKDGSIDSNKVGEDVAKRKVYTGIYPNLIEDADKVVCSDSDADECSYYVKISAPEIEANNFPLVMLYQKNANLGDNIWSSRTVSFESGYAYSEYASDDNDIVDWEKFGEEYKLVISY